MRKNVCLLLGLFLLASLGALGQGTKPASPAKPAGEAKTLEMMVLPPFAMKWQEGPGSLPKGAQVAVLEGDPSKDGLFTMRLKVPANFKVAPHWHPTGEYVTVISGRPNLGMGDVFDAKKAAPMSPGAFASIPAKMVHFVWTDRETVIQIHGMGPFQVVYVNPADDPRAASKK